MKLYEAMTAFLVLLGLQIIANVVVSVLSKGLRRDSMVIPSSEIYIQES